MTCHSLKGLPRVTLHDLRHPPVIAVAPPVQPPPRSDRKKRGVDRCQTVLIREMVMPRLANPSRLPRQGDAALREVWLEPHADRLPNPRTGSGWATIAVCAFTGLCSHREQSTSLPPCDHHLGRTPG